MGFSYFDDIITMQTWEASKDIEEENKLTLGIFNNILYNIWENTRKKKRRSQINTLNIIFKIK